MIDLNKLQDNSVVVCPNSVKDYLVKYISTNKPELRVKFLSKKELIEGFNYTYDYDALVALKEEYKFSYSNCEELLENLLKDECDFSEKTKLAHEAYSYLNDKQLLKKNPLFKYLLNNKDIYVYGYSSDDKELNNVLVNFKDRYQFLTDEGETYKHSLIKFKTIEDEVLYVFNDIIEKLNSGVDINQIHFLSYPSDYSLLIKKYSHYFKLPVASLESKYLIDSPIYKRFFELLKDNSKEEAYKKLSDEFNNDPFDAIGRIANVINKISVAKLEGDKYFELLNYVASKTTLKPIKYDKCITIVNQNDIVDPNDFVYVLGFSLGSYPSIARDDDFFLDDEKKVLGLNSSIIKSEINEFLLTNFINHTKNMVITHKDKIGKTKFYQSILVSKLEMDEKTVEISDKRYNKALADIEIANALYNKDVYGLDTSASNSKDELDGKYKSYDHSFKGLTSYDSEQDLELSYSSINQYYECPFQYFIKRVLKADIFENRFNTKLGNLFHKIFEECKSATDYKEEEYKDYIEQNFETAKERFFVKLLLPQVKAVLEKNDALLAKSEFKNIKRECKFEIPMTKNPKSLLVGKIDKILMDLNEKNAAIVDYKSGKFSFHEDKNAYGLELQLPIYSYALSKDFPDFYNTGVYIQNICLSKEDLFEKKNTAYTLDGLTVEDLSKFKRFDSELGTLKDSKGKPIKKSMYVSGVSEGTSGLTGSGCISEKDFKVLKANAEKQIDNCFKYIRKGVFPISPIKFKSDKGKEFATGKTLCDFCSCKSICFMKDEDVRFIDDSKK